MGFWGKLFGVRMEAVGCLSDVSKVVVCGRRNTLASFSDGELQFSWQAQHFGDLHRHFAWQRCVFFAKRIVRAG